MRINYAILLGWGGIMAGCFDGAPEINGPGASDNQENRPAIAARIGGATNFFKGYSEIQSNGGPSVDRFADCGTDQVMTGVGARSAKPGWTSPPVFNGVTVYCRSINWNGSLGTQTSVVSGSPGTQSVVYADPNKVVVGVGGTVGGSVFTRAVILQCPWDASTRSVNPTGCSWKASDGSTSAELYFDVHTGVGAPERPKTIATGAGFSTGLQDNLKIIRLTVASLK